MGWLPRSCGRPIAGAATLAALCLPCGIARAADAPTLPFDLTVTGDVRVIGVDGERSWLDGGFGKLRFGAGKDESFSIRPRAVEGTIAWQPHLTWSLSGTFVGIAQRGQDKPMDLSEAYLTYKPMPLGKVKLSVRGGLFWPPVSLEHSGAEWSVRDTITPSAINSWIGEEVKTAGIEVTAATELGGHRLAATAGLFALNDTAGTLLAFRGWALHDEKATAFSAQPLPHRNPFFATVQDDYSYPVIELDDRPGYYLKLSWAPPGPFELQAFHYDNRANPEAFNSDMQWGWRTRFDHLGAILDLDDKTRLIAQGITGSTVMGFKRRGVRWIDTHFQAAFLLATRQIGRGSISARIEAFGTQDHGSRLGPGDHEDGWAFTAAVRRPLTSYATMVFEVVHIDSRRGSRQRDDLAPQQSQTLVQLALRLRI
jgi:hypothetical protein